MQALETVPGVNQVSEGHASVPAIRGLARGRTLLLIDGGRVTSERRVGPSATFADPAAFEGIDVARGPGSVAYGSDALGGVISVRTRRAEPGSPLQVRGSGTLGGGIPDRRGLLEVSKGLPRGGVIFQAHGRSADDWDGPEDGEILNSGWKDRGFLARVDHQVGKGTLSVGLQSDFGKDIERPRNNSNVVRFYYPYEDSHRFTSSYELLNVAGFQQMGVTGIRRHVRAADGSGPLRHGDDRAQHRARRHLGQRLPRQGQRHPGCRPGAPRVRRRRERPVRSERARRAAGLRPRRRDHQRRHQCLDRQRPPHRHGCVCPGRRTRWRSRSGCRAACAAITSPPRTRAVSSAIDRPTTARSPASPRARSDRSRA